MNEFSNRLAPFASGVTVILLDRLNTRWDDQIIARNAVVQFLNQVRPDDRIALYVLDSDAIRVLHDFTSETSSLLRALSRHRSRMSGELAATEPEAPELGEAEFDQWLQETQAKIAAAMTENRIQTTSGHWRRSPTTSPACADERTSSGSLPVFRSWSTTAAARSRMGPK